MSFFIQGTKPKDISMGRFQTHDTQPQPLYTVAQRARRDGSVWTLVQGILAPVQFVIFLVSVVLVVRYLATGEGYFAATVSVLLKTAALYIIMVTGAIWEKVVFGQYLFAPGFFWEDVFSFVVIALHTLYLYGLITGSIAPQTLMLITLAAYITYVINAGQFLWKLRIARMQSEVPA
jgi:3-vinyl bacteriochlorophyllide hydratase